MHQVSNFLTPITVQFLHSLQPVHIITVRQVYTYVTHYIICIRDIDTTVLTTVQLHMDMEIAGLVGI